MLLAIAIGFVVGFAYSAIKDMKAKTKVMQDELAYLNSLDFDQEA